MSFWSKTKSWFGARFSEPSSWTALGGFLAFVGVMADIQEAPAIVNAIVSNADALAGGSYTATTLQLLGGIALAKGFIKPEKFND